MTFRNRHLRPVVFFVVVAAASLGTLQCGGSGAGGQQSAGIRIEPSRIWITVENTSTETLNKVQVFVVPHGESTLFSTTQTTLAVGEKRDFPIANFRGRDGTPLDLRVARIKSVRVTAVSAKGEELRAEVPWK